MNRVQRKRTKGFKMPPNTKCVNRGTKWGNPIKLIGDMIYINASHRRKILDPWVYLCMGDINDVVELYRLLVTDNISLTDRYFESTYDIDWWLDYFRNLDVKELNGKNLACFCSLSSPCHADVLLELAQKNDA